MRLKKIALITASFLAVIALSVGSTMAFFSYTAEAKNTFTFGEVKIFLTETNFNEDAAKNLVSGIEIPKNPVVNIDKNSEPCYVRVKYALSDSSYKDKFTVDFNTDDWTEKDGYYYYKLMLDNAGKKSTEPLFTKVTIGDVVEGTDTGFDIIVSAEAIQADGITDIDAAWATLNKA